ncbi:hypothetical protein B7463_g875, partial [Scytalidium lignicola]
MTVALILFIIGVAIETPGLSKLSMAMLFIYEFAFGASWLTLPWLISAEITPLRLRHVGGALSPFSQWMWSFVVIEITPVAIDNIGWRLYLLYIICTALSIPFIYFFLLETKGKTLEDINYIFAEGDARIELERRFAEAAYQGLEKDANSGEVQIVNATIEEKV